MERKANIKDRTVKLLTVLLNVFILPLIAFNYYSGNFMLVYAGSIFLVLLTLNYFVYSLRTAYNNWSTVFLLLYGTLSVFLFWEGGTGNSGHLWALLFPFFAYEFKNYKKALRYVASFFLVLFLISVLTYQGIFNENQPMETMVVFGIVMISLAIFLHIYDKRRSIADIHLHRSKEKYQALFNDLTLGAVVINRDMQILDANKKIMEWFPQLADLSALCCYETLHPENDGKLCLNCPVDKTFKDGKIHALEQYKQTDTGGRFFRLVTNPMFDATGQVYAVMGTLEDITEQKLHEKERAERESRFSSLVLSLSDVIFTLDTEQRHTGVYGDWVAKLGLTREHFLGKTSAEVLGKQPAFEHEQANLKALKGEPVLYEWIASINADVKYYQTSLSPIFDDKKKVTGLVGVARDITEYKNAVQKSAYQTKFFGLVADISADFVTADASNIAYKIEHMLEASGLFFRVDRTFLYQFSSDLKYMTNTHEWCAPGIVSVKNNLQNNSVEGVPWIARLLKNRETLYVPDVDAMPDELEEDKKELQRRMIQSVLVIPVVKRNRMLGYFGFDTVERKKMLGEEQLRLLNVLGNILGDALVKTETEHELKIMNQRYDQLARQSGTFKWQITPEGMYTDVSSIVTEVLGYTPEELNGKKYFYDLHPEEGRQAFKVETLKELSLKKAFDNYANKIVTKNGELKWVSTNCIPILDNSGNLLGYHGSDTDITDRQQMEAALRYNNKMQELISGLSAEFVVAKATNINDKIQTALGKAGAFFEFDRAYVFSYSEDHQYYQLTHEWCAPGIGGSYEINKQLAFSDYPWWEAQVNRGKPIYVKSIFALTAQKEKEIFKDQQVKSFIGFPVIYGEKVVGLFGFDAVKNFRKDITDDQVAIMQIIANIIADALERIKGEKALIASEILNRQNAARYRAFVDATNTGAWEYDLQSGKIWTSNQYWNMLGFTPAEKGFTKGLVDARQLWSKLITQEDLPFFIENLEQYFVSGSETFELTFRMYHKNGQEVWVLSRGSMLTDDQNPEQAIFVGTNIDITAQKRYEQTIKAKNKELESYLYVASHDLRSPLVNIQGFSSRMQKKIEKLNEHIEPCITDEPAKSELAKIIDDDIPQTLSFIHTNVARMDALIKGLLEISRTGKLKMHIEQVDMQALIHKILLGFSFQLDEIGGEATQDELPHCYGDSSLLTRLFANLVDNAIKYRKPDSPLKLKVQAQRKGGYVQYCVKDNGKGISRRNTKKIWDVFYRIDPVSSVSGEGIGLNMAAKITEKHKGYIWVKSVEGKGSAFFVELPAEPFIEEQ